MKNIALVTGADRGIGLQVCRQLAQRGYRVILGAHDLAKGQQAASSLIDIGGEVNPVLLDLTKPDTFTDLASFIETNYGRLDALINNAGIALDWDYQADSVPMELIRQTFEVNFFGMVHLSLLQNPKM